MPLSPLVATALEGGSGTLRSRLDRIRRHSPTPGRYTLLGEIGTGGMGKVLRVWDEVLDREVALKIVPLEIGSDATPEEQTQHAWKLERFIEEARVTGQLEHPGIVPIHDFALDEDGMVFFTMPLVQGDTLKRIFKLARNQLDGWTMHRALAVIHKVCQTVAFAHESGVVHRDLKPENIMVGRFGEVYVMDWGLALILGKKDRESVVGTPAYMSPEQATGRLDCVGPQSDVYSVGALLYELFSGRMPHEISLELERNEGRSTDAIPTRPPRPLGQVAHGTPPELGAIVDKAMAPIPGDRYPGMAELADDLSAWLEGRIVHAYDTSMRTRLRKWRQRNRALAWALEAMAIIVVISVSIIIHQQQSQIRQVRAANRRELANSYIANLAAADLGLRAHETNEAKRRLAACKEDARGWEWGHLQLRADPSLVTLRGHTKSVRSIAISPNGRHIATASDDASVRIWNAESGKLVHELKGHENVVTKVAFHPVKDLFASTSRDHTVRLWSLPTGRCIRTISEHDNDVMTLAFDPEGRLLATGDTDGNIVVTWFTPDGGTSVLKIADEDITALAHDPYKEVLVVGMHGSDTLQLIDPASGNTRGSVRIGDHVRAVAVDPKGRYYAAATGKTIQLIDAVKLKVETVLAGHSDVVNTVAFGPSGKSLASGGADNVILLWDVDSGEVRLTFDGHDLDVNSIALHPDGKRLVSASEDDTARIWSRNVGACLVLEGHLGWVNAVSFSTDGKHLFSGGRDKTLRRWVTATGAETKRRNMKEIIASLESSPRGSLALGCAEGEILIGRAADLDVWRTLATGIGYARILAFDAAGERIFQESSEGTVTAHELSSGRQLFELETDDTVYSLAVRPDGECFAVGTREGTIEFRSTDRGELLHTTKLPARAVTTLAYDPTGRYLAAGTQESKIYILSTETHEHGQSLAGHEKLISALAFSPRGDRLVSGSLDHTLRIWDPESGASLLTLRGHTQPITEIAFDPAGENIVSASKDGTLRLWRGK